MKSPKKSKRPYKIFTKTNPTDAQWTHYKSYRTAAQMEQGFADLIAHRSNQVLKTASNGRRRYVPDRTPEHTSHLVTGTD
jgi:hypothetical protein